MKVKAGMEIVTGNYRFYVTHCVGDVFMLLATHIPSKLEKWLVGHTSGIYGNSGIAWGRNKWVYRTKEEAQQAFQEKCGVPIFDWAAEEFPSKKVAEKSSHRALVEQFWEMYKAVRDNTEKYEQEYYDNYFKEYRA